MLFAPWDLDQTWGNVWTDGLELLTTVRFPIDYEMNPAAMGLMRGLSLGMNGLAERIQSRYTQLRASILSDASLRGILNNYEARVYGSGAILRDHIRWPKSAFAQSFSAFEALVCQRTEYMDKFIADLSRAIETNKKNHGNDPAKTTRDVSGQGWIWTYQ